MPSSSMQTVAGVAVLVLALHSGCLGGFAPSEAEPTTEGTFVPPKECSGNETAPGFELPAGDLPEQADGFALEANASIVERGDAVRFALTNVADERRYTGTKPKYLLQRRTDSGKWETVTLLREPYLGFNATAIHHSPGEGFAWSFEATAAGFTEGKYAVCEPLRPGDYRFVYVGDSPLAVRFELTE